MWNVSVIPKTKDQREVFDECFQLYQEHDGACSWSCGHSISEEVVFDNFLFGCSLLITCRSGIKLVGFAMSIQFPYQEGNVSWITQMVVHKGYRRRGIGSRLCSAVWKLKSIVIGLVSPHPYAIRALEKATNRTCDPLMISNYAIALIADANIPCFKLEDLMLTSEQSIIRTGLKMGLNDINSIINREVDWKLGRIKEGEEFLAFIFESQSQNTQNDTEDTKKPVTKIKPQNSRTNRSKKSRKIEYKPLRTRSHLSPQIISS